MSNLQLDGEQLIQLQQATGLSEREMAAALDVPFNSMHGIMYRAKRKLGEVDHLEDTVFGNVRTIVGDTRRVKSLQDLIETCHIDLDEWIIDKHEIRKWDVGLKMVEQDITWANGKIEEGYKKSSKKPTVEQLFYVKAVMIKRFPEALEPLIVPVRFKIDRMPIPTPKASTYHRALVITDPHFGFIRDLNTGKLTPLHDRAALDVVLQMAANNEFDVILIGGDLLDLAEWSDKYARTPEMQFTTQPALYEAAWFLGQLRQLCPKVIYIEGNHEDRIPRLILKRNIQAYGLSAFGDRFRVLSMPHLLGLEGMDVDWSGNYRDGEVWLGDSVVCRHGDKARARSGMTASAAVEETQVTELVGHIHRREMATKTLWTKDGPVFVTAASFGCLCKIDGTVPSQKKRMNWQKGLGVVDYSTDEAYLQSVLIQNNHALFEGSLYEPDGTYFERLQNDIDWEF